MENLTDEEKCAESPTGKHEPDWHSVSAEFDGDELYVDVNCKHCGHSGCVGTHNTLSAGVNW